MGFLKKTLVFLLVFAVMFTSVAVVCTAIGSEQGENPFVDETIAPFITEQKESDENILDGDNADKDISFNSSDKVDLKDSGASAYSARLLAPKYSNPYYYSDKNIFYKYGWGMPNCTCYAYGRAYEILEKEPNLCMYSAYLWYDYNKEHKYYAYGQTPKLGAIACWVYSSGTSGHVAVVEKISKTEITFSNSAYGGDEFYTSTAPINDPSNGNSYWHFQGYIYIGEYQSNEKIEEPQGDIYRITSDNGVNLRNGAGTSYSVLGGIPYGKELTVTKTQKADGYTWGYTTYCGVSGWFVTDFAKLIYQKEEKKEEPAPRVLMGDVDNDGYLTVIDATMIQKMLAKIVAPNDLLKQRGDYDGDSVITIMDAVKIQRNIADNK